MAGARRDGAVRASEHMHSALPASGQVRQHDSRFSWVDHPASPPLASFATRALMRWNDGTASRPSNPRADRVRFLVFSRQRSASSTLLNELRRHPNITCHYEVLNIKQMPDVLRYGLNATYFTAVADLPRFMAQFWDFCPAQVRGARRRAR